MKSFASLLLIAALFAFTGCGGAKSDIVGTWEGSQGTLVITDDGKWIAKSGPMSINLEYKVEKTEGNVVDVMLNEPGKPAEKDAGAKITVDSKTQIRISDGGMFAGTFKKSS